MKAGIVSLGSESGCPCLQIRLRLVLLLAQLRNPAVVWKFNPLWQDFPKNITSLQTPHSYCTLLYDRRSFRDKEIRSYCIFSLLIICCLTMKICMECPFLTWPLAWWPIRDGACEMLFWFWTGFFQMASSCRKGLHCGFTLDVLSGKSGGKNPDSCQVSIASCEYGPCTKVQMNLT